MWGCWFWKQNGSVLKSVNPLKKYAFSRAPSFRTPISITSDKFQSSDCVDWLGTDHGRPNRGVGISQNLNSLARRLKCFCSIQVIGLMGRREHDLESVVTVNFDEDDTPRSKSGKPLSEKKMAQLSAARNKALHARRVKLKSRLESKLSELRQILGPDMRSDTVERVAQAMMRQEVTLREKQNQLVSEVRDVINDFKTDLRAIKERLQKPTSHSLSSLQQPKVRPKAVSEASSTGSGRTLTLTRPSPCDRRPFTEHSTKSHS